MRLLRLLPMLLVLGVAPGALAQSPPAPEPAPPPAPEAPPTPVEVVPAPEPAAPEAPSEPSSPEPLTTEPSTPEPTPDRAAEIAPSASAASKPPAEPVSLRAHSPLTLEGKLGFSFRPESSSGFQNETPVGAELGLSLYADLKRELAVGLEIERTSLGRGTAINKLDSVTIDYTVTSAMLGLRAYPLRTEYLDLFVGFRVGAGIQGVSAAGTRSDGTLAPAVAYTCSGSDSPAFQIGGGIGARLMLTPRWGLTAHVGGTGRRLTSDVVDECARGIGTVTTIAAGLGIGYDFDLDP